MTRAIITVTAARHYKAHVPQKQQIVQDVACVHDVLDLWTLPNGPLQWRLHAEAHPCDNPPYDVDTSQLAARLALQGRARCQYWLAKLKDSGYTTNNVKLTLSILRYLGALGAPRDTREHSVNEFVQVRG